MTAAGCFVWLAWNLTEGHLTAFDEAARAAAHAMSAPLLTLLMETITWLGSQIVVLGVAATVALTLLVLRRDRSFWMIVTGIGGAEVIEPVLKAHFHRQRPTAFFDVVSPESFSFPSGHALLSVCLYSLLATLISSRLSGRGRWIVRLGAAALILAIGFSRVYLGVHYPSDVIGGYLVGLAWISALVAVPGLRE